MSKVYTDKVRETACGTEGNGKSADSHREASLESSSSQAVWPFDSGLRQKHRLGSVNLQSSSSWTLKNAVFHRY